MLNSCCSVWRRARRTDRIAGALVIALAAMSPAGQARAADCVLDDPPERVHRASSEGYEVRFYFIPAEPRTGELFEVAGRVCRTDGLPFEGNVSIDSTMPMHGHGMNYRPRVDTAKGGGHFRATGFALHMQGQWRFEWRLKEAGDAQTLYFAYTAR